ncbi:MAG: hypothetical protein CSB01_03055, partial [Bacteroidia bacterium]
KLQKGRKKTKVIQRKKGWIGNLTRIFTPNIQEAACFEMVWKMSGRERKYKQTVYPVFGYLLIFILMYAFKGKDLSLNTLQASKRYLVFLYFPMLLSFSLIANLSFSENKKSSWFFRAMPIHSVGVVLRGALKAILIKYFVPTFVVIASCSVYIWGVAIIDDIILAFITNVLVAILLQMILVHDLPFSAEKNANDMGGNFFKGVLLMISISVAVLIHYGLTFINYAVAIAIIPFFISIFFALKSYNKMNWSRIHS